MSIVRHATAPALQVLGDQLRVLLPSSGSTHQLSVMTVEVPAGAGVPPHRHAEEEGYFMLGGELVLALDGTEHALRAGDFAHVPSQAVHGYRNVGAAPARFLAITVGGPIDRFFAALSERVRKMPEDAPAMAQVMQEFGVAMETAPAA